MMKTSYRPAEAPLFLWETLRCQPWGSVSSSNSGVRFGSTTGRLRGGTRPGNFFWSTDWEDEAALEVLGRAVEERALEAFESVEEGGTTPWFGSSLKLPSCI